MRIQIKKQKKLSAEEAAMLRTLADNLERAARQNGLKSKEYKQAKQMHDNYCKALGVLK